LSKFTPFGSKCLQRKEQLPYTIATQARRLISAPRIWALAGAGCLRSSHQRTRHLRQALEHSSPCSRSLPSRRLHTGETVWYTGDPQPQHGTAGPKMRCNYFRRICIPKPGPSCPLKEPHDKKQSARQSQCQWRAESSADRRQSARATALGAAHRRWSAIIKAPSRWHNVDGAQHTACVSDARVANQSASRDGLV